jgi:hypothetical protein
MTSNALVRSTFLCDASTIRLIEEQGEPADIILSFRKPMVDAVDLSQRSLGYEIPATETPHAALYVGDGKVVHAYPLTTTSTGGIRLETLGVASRNSEICILRFKPSDHLKWKKQREKITKIARLICGGKYDYYEVMKVGFASAYNIWSSSFKDKISANKEPTSRNINKLKTSYTCAKLIFDCYDYAMETENPLNNGKYMISPFVVPAMFYINEELHDGRIENGRLCF